MDLTVLLGKESNNLLDLGGIVFIDPFFEKAIRHLQFEVFSLDGEQAKGLYPNIKILLTDSFF